MSIMLNQNARLLNQTEVLDIYGVPALDDIERREYFTFDKQEIYTLKSFRQLEDAVYFAICLAFFKLKRTLVDFSYRETTSERQHVIERYFNNQGSIKSLPKNHNKISRIENKVLTLCNSQRYAREMVHTIKSNLLLQAPNNPRQRQLCKALLDLFTKHHVAIPAYTTVQKIVREIWHEENNRVTQIYLRYTNKKQRDLILSLLDQTDNLHHIVSIKRDMKGFNTTELNTEIDKHHLLEPIFMAAKIVMPKLRLPTSTINYYANLINYYNSPRLKQLNTNTVQLYLLCYSFTRFQMLNDNLLDALKKRTLDYHTKALEYAKEQALNHLDLLQGTRQKVSDLLIAIKHHDAKQVPKNLIHQYVPENELLTAAKLLVDDKFNKDLLFWQYIDSVKSSIILNLRKLFLTMDFVITNNSSLEKVVNYIKQALMDNKFYHKPLPQHVKAWVDNKHQEYIFCDDNVIYNRLEFLLYKQIVHHITTNKLTLKHSIKYKRVEDDLISSKQWSSKRSSILKKFPYEQLNTPIEKIIQTKKESLTELYHTVNQAISNGENEQVKIITNANGKQTWSLRPLEEFKEPNDSLFAEFQQRSIVDVIQFVNNKTKFTKAFESILPRATRSKQDNDLIMAAVLANAIRLGTKKMASISDLNESALLTAESAYIRSETLLSAIDIVNNAAAQLPIYKKWYIDSIMHASLDGLKLESRLRNVKARYSSKYFGRGIGVSSYNHIFNYFSLASRIIGTNEYEGHFAFEMVHHQNTSIIKPECISADKHGDNPFNPGLFDLTDKLLALRIPKPHNQIFWGFGSSKDYKDYIIKPTKFPKEQLIFNEWDNVKKYIMSMLLGNPSILISKLSSANYRSDTKKALTQYSNIVRSQFLLKYIHDIKYRRAILVALNRGEAYNNLYRAITILSKGTLRGRNEVEMEIWNQCTRLISSIILYYNSYILNSLYQNSKDEHEREFLISLSPSAWVHINMLGYYQFCGKFSDELVDYWIKNWDWQKHL